MSGICSRLCGYGYAPLAHDGEETVVLPAEADDKNLARALVGQRMTDAVSAHILPTLAEIVRQYAFPLMSDRMQFPSGHGPEDIDRIVEVLSPLIENMYRSKLELDYHERFRGESRQLWGDILSKLTRLQYENLMKDPRLQINLPEWTYSKILDIESNSVPSSLQIFSRHFQELIDYCDARTKEKADSVVDLLIQFYRKKENRSQYDDPSMPLIKFIAGDTLAWWQAPDLEYRLHNQGRRYGRPRVFSFLVNEGEVTIPPAMLERCNNNLGFKD